MTPTPSNADIIYGCCPTPNLFQNAFDERKAIVSRLERDVNVVESEGMKLEMELRRIVTLRMQRELAGDLVTGGRGHVPGEANDDEEDVEEELLNEILGVSDDRLSNSQLYEDKQRQNQLYSRLQKLHIKTTSTNTTDLPINELQVNIFQLVHMFKDLQTLLL